MKYFRQLKRMICSVLAISMLSMGLHGIAAAGIITTTDLVQAQHIQQEKERIQEWMAREDVRDQLVLMGVNVDEAKSRVDSMTDQEVQLMAAKMDEMPAGSGVLEVLVIVALVWVILELTGVTDLTPKF